ncbi:MAG TPA: ATP phosphoribosyltransferase [Ktedonobacteraceae bacterium]|nr:ATP phosphoribosyltransferase [Ktedonobacteraceae bacterium]
MKGTNTLQLPKEHVKLAIQKEGRLTESTLELLHTAGLHIEAYKQRLFSSCRNFPLTVLFVRDDDIPEYVSEGVVDLGIVGKNLVVETQQVVEELLPLNYGHCTLTVAIPRESSIENIQQLAGRKIATSYPITTKKFFEEQNIDVDIITISGSVEVTPALGVASAIVDLVSTGSSLKLNDLVPLKTVLQSQSLLIAHPASVQDETKAPLIDSLLMRFRGVMNARSFKYIMMNAPTKNVPAITELCTGLRSPTVLPTADPEWVAVHIAVPEDDFWNIIEQLRILGSQGILVTPIEKLFL